jgi:4-cresol dehydrogenase (hydroxylating)
METSPRFEEMNPLAETDVRERRRRFLELCAPFLKDGQIRPPTPPELTGTGARPREIIAVVFPHSVEQVQRVLAAARATGVPVHPVSQGKNWGLGSQLPVADGAVLLHLSGMKRIREINLEFGYAVVEPGVTQEDLARELRRRNAPYYVDVTGAGKDTSLIGNTMERGIAYNSQRTRDTRSLEVVLGDGSLLRTGFQDPRAEALNHLYTHGIGPDLTGLFYQSGFGVVTALTLDLRPIPEASASVNLNVDTEQIPLLMERLRDLVRQDVIQGVPHVANVERLRSTFVPAMVRTSQGRMTPAEAEKILDRLLPRPWATVISLSGPSSILAARIRLLRRSLRGIGSIRVMTPARARWAERLTRWFAPSLHIFLKTIKDLNALGFGRPTDDPQGFLDYESRHPLTPTVTTPDDHARGFLYVLPLAPLSAVAAKGMMDAADRTGRRLGFRPAVTLNLLDAKVLEAVVSVVYDKSSVEETRRAQRFAEEFLDECAVVGAFPYRVHIDQMHRALPSQGSWAQILRKLKNLCDPQAILAPGRYTPDAPRVDERSAR